MDKPSVKCYTIWRVMINKTPVRVITNPFGRFVYYQLSENKYIKANTTSNIKRYVELSMAEKIGEISAEDLILELL